MKTLKHLALLSIYLLMISACATQASETEAELEGNWRLQAVYADPGNGSGEFRTVDSDIWLVLSSNGKIHSNGSLCTFNNDADIPSEGNYSVVDSTLLLPNCYGPFKELSFEKTSNELIIWYPCIEGCARKFVK